MARKTKNLIISLILCVSFMFSACSCNSNEQTDAPAEKSLTTYDGGVHVMTATDTDIPLVKDGATSYVLVVPKTFKNSLENSVFNDCKSEFPYLFKLATGIDMQVIGDEGLSHNANNTYISIGETTLFKTSGLTYDKEQLYNDGTRIITKDKTVFLLGGKGYGPLYAVYDFMEITFNFDVFDIDTVVIDKNVDNINIKNFDVTNIPDAHNRQRNLSSHVYAVDENSQDSRYYGKRSRLNSDGLEILMPFYPSYDVNGQTWAHGHNTLDALPIATYKDSHPLWYSDNGLQLCYTAHGNQEELRAMAEEIVKKTIFSHFRNNKEDFPLIEYISLSMEDNYNFCSCEACLEAEATYNSAGALTLFTNLYASIFKKWQDGTPADELFEYSTTEGCDEWININLTPEDREKYVRDNFTFRLMAYNSMLIAPAKLNESSGEYEPIDEKCVLNDNVSLYFADIEMDWSNSYFAENNKESYDNILAWASLTDNPAAIYTYYEYPDRSTWFYDGFNILSNKGMAFLKNTIGVKGYYACGTSNKSEERVTGFKGYFSYLYGKILWDMNADVSALTEKYFANEFGEAKDVMYNMFVEMRQYFAAQYEQFDLHQKNSIYHKLYSKTYWDKNTAKKWLDDCYKAFNLIETVKNADPKRYNELYCHIAAEMMYPASIYLDFFSEEISNEERTALTNRLLNDYYVMGLTEYTPYFAYGNITYLSKIQTWGKV